MSSSSFLQIIREAMRGRLEITQETSGKGARITIRADRVIAILVVAVLVIVIIK